jgi:D-alanine-D-alanine ligase
MEILPAAKDEEDFFYSREVKRDWTNRVVYHCPPKGIDPFLKKDLERIAKEAFAAFGCRDVCRVDLRVDELGKVYLLEINPLPGLSPEYADLVIMARAVGWTYEKLIMTIFNHALARYKIPSASLQ